MIRTADGVASRSPSQQARPVPRGGVGRTDRLAPARGVVIGVAFGTTLWIGIILVVRSILRALT